MNKIKFILQSRLLLLSGITSLTFLLTGCFDDSEVEVPPVNVAYVSLYHAAPDAGDMDILLDRGRAINTSSFSYGDFTDYLAFRVGDRSFEFANADSNALVYLDTTITFVRNRLYSIFVADTLANLQTVVLEDSSASPGAGKAMVRVVHLSPDVPEINVVIDDEEVFAELPYKEGSAFKEVASGTMTFRFLSADNEPFLMVPSVQLQSQAFYTIILKGFLNPPAGNSNEISTEIIRN